MKRIVRVVSPLPFHSVQGHIYHRYNSSSISNIDLFTRSYSDSIDKKSFENTIKFDFNTIPGVKSSGEKLIIMYTCKVCETRSARKISKHSYQRGVVVVKCACCNNMHLICDHIGVFEDKGWTIDQFLSEHRSSQVTTTYGDNPTDSSPQIADSSSSSSKYITEENVYELTLEDIVGRSSESASNTIEAALMSGSTTLGSDQSMPSLTNSYLKSHSHSVDTNTVSRKDDDDDEDNPSK